MPFILTPEEILAEGLVFDGLDLGQGPNGSIQLDSFTPPLFKKRYEWVEGADSDGALLVRDPLITTGQPVIKLAIAASDRDAAQGLIGLIVDKLEEADRQPAGIPLVWTPSGSSVSATCYVLTGEVTEFPVDWESGYMAYQPSVTITLEVRPGWYGTPTTISGTATAGPLVTLDLPNVGGDVPSDISELIITESSSQSRRTFEWGSEHLYYNVASPWSLVLDSDSLVTSGFAGTQTTLAGAYDPGGAGNSIIVSTVATSPQAICGTGAQPHVGTFRVKLRMNSGPGGCTDVSIQFAWRAGDGSYTTNDPVVVTSTTANEFLERDLGLITIPTASAGTQTWDGRVEASRPSDSDTIYVDYLMLIPVEAGYGKAVASYAYSPGVITARDSFAGLGSGSALSGRTPDAGAAWVTSGVATDFVGSTTTETTTTQPRVTRTTAGAEAEARVAVLGSAMTNQEVQATAYTSTYSAQYLGVVARYVDDDNYLRLYLESLGGGLRPNLKLVTKIAGVEATVMSVQCATGFSIATPYRFTLVVFTSGRAIGFVTRAATGAVEGTVDTTSSVIATGGALASGKGGIADQAIFGSPARKYDDVAVLTPAAEPVVIFSGRSIEIRSDSTERESSAGGSWGRPQSYRGSRFRVNPAGDQDRTTRVVCKASRNDLGSAEDTNLTDQIMLEVTYTPRWSVVPRA